ncbi:molybdopterin molybdotransferase MoeA [Flexibacterium corallicola]|uniref:molybdopterin molybdotransferase MoeA n=1 Tax=Flexibacterium corallicola TaxID=3037259 RepID=UPI00286F9778|nr:gephyrin-like molybdotransferase Glp [Pseudovibrio sp. M1P-2-3]
MSLISVEEAKARLLASTYPLEAEMVSLLDAGGRILAKDLCAERTQPPFAASAMDGYAVIAEDTNHSERPIQVIGEVAAGQSFSGKVTKGSAVRIFTGAPVPDGADAILMQENADRESNIVFAKQPVSKGKFIRPEGLDFSKGEVLLKSGTKLDYRELSLAASMNYSQLPVYKRPLVAILANGDELVAPGEEPGPNQIVASNQIGIARLARECDANVLLLGIAPDNKEQIADKIKQALEAKADILVTLGGASVGDHDYIQEVLGQVGMSLEFWRIAMRPGKPLMAGHIGQTKVLGLPGNPVSSLVCALLFLKPILRKITGQLDLGGERVAAILGASLEENDFRQDFLRAELTEDNNGNLVATPFAIQDSSMLSMFTKAHALIVRKPNAPAAQTGEQVNIIPLGPTF